MKQEYLGHYMIADFDAIIRVWATREFRKSVEEVVKIVNGPKIVKSYSNSNEVSRPGWAALLYFRDMRLRIKK